MSNRKKIKQTAELDPSMHPVEKMANGLEPLVNGFAGKYNGYVCNKCDKAYLTLDIDNGVTPMFMPCLATEGCDGRAHSMGYPEGDPPASMGEPIIHWVRPKDMREFLSLPPAVKQHVRQGGLIRRATAAAPDWVKALV